MANLNTSNSSELSKINRAGIEWVPLLNLMTGAPSEALCQALASCGLIVEEDVSGSKLFAELENLLWKKGQTFEMQGWKSRAVGISSEPIPEEAKEHLSALGFYGDKRPVGEGLTPDVLVIGGATVNGVISRLAWLDTIGVKPKYGIILAGCERGSVLPDNDPVTRVTKFLSGRVLGPVSSLNEQFEKFVDREWVSGARVRETAITRFIIQAFQGNGLLKNFVGLPVHDLLYAHPDNKAPGFVEVFDKLAQEWPTFRFGTDSRVLLGSSVPHFPYQLGVAAKYFAQHDDWQIFSGLSATGFQTAEMKLDPTLKEIAKTLKMQLMALGFMKE